MSRSLRGVLIAAFSLFSISSAQTTGQPAGQTAGQTNSLVGTWSTKSHQVFTGPGFYDPVNEKMFEPSLTGISYSFSDDGHYEEAYYRAISNPTEPQCPKGIMQWQHGTYVENANGSLQLTPFAVDGRQLLSNPCSYETAIYTRYNQSEFFQRYTVYTDPYHNVLRLDLYQFDGSPMNPMFIAYSPPQMLPTQTLNPTTASSTGGAQSTSKPKAKRDAYLREKRDKYMESFNRNVLMKSTEPPDADKWWWIGVGMTAVGGIAYFCF